MTLKRKLFRGFWANLFFRLAGGETRIGLRKNPGDAFTFFAPYVDVAEHKQIFGNILAPVHMLN